MDSRSNLSIWDRLRSTPPRLVTLLAFFVFLFLAWWIDRNYFSSRLQGRLAKAALTLWPGAGANQKVTGTVLLLPVLTLFLAYANLYLKISVRAPSIQRRLQPRAFLNVPFGLYFTVYLLLAVLAYMAVTRNFESWFAGVVVAALLGIGAGNADIKFGGFSVQPLAEFLRALEAVVEAGISTQTNEWDIAKRAAMRDQLALSVNAEVLERECRILEFKEEDLEKLKKVAGNNDMTYRGLLAREIVKTSEANAERLVQEARGTGLWLRFRKGHR